MHIEIRPVEGGKCPTYTAHLIGGEDVIRPVGPCSLSALIDWLITSGWMYELQDSIDAGIVTHE